MNHSAHLRVAAALLTGLTFCCAADRALAQGPIDWIAPGAVGVDEADYAAGANWGGFGFVPSGPLADETAVINNGALSVLTTLLDPFSDVPGGLTIGGASGETGGLEIRSDGNMDVIFIDGSVNSAGDTVVGGAGVGTLGINGTGIMSTQTLTAGGAAGSGIRLADTASLTVNTSSTLNSALHITGPTVTFAADTLTFGGNHSYTAELTSAAASTIGVTGNAGLGGNLTLDLSGAPVPVAGDSYDIIRAGSVSGVFGQVNFNGVTLGPGQKFIVGTVDDGGDKVVRARLAEVLVLQIDRDSGAMSITNPAGASISMDGYQVESALGTMNAGGFAGLQSQAVGDWEESNLSNNHLAELSATSSLAVNSTITLGSAYQVPGDLPFGTSPQDHTITYRDASGSGEVIEGLVEYTGTEFTNNFVLRIDPTTGDGELYNDSMVTFSFDGYQIKSESGSLDDAGFTGLGGDWVNSNPLTDQLADLNPEGSQSISPGQSLAIGKVFDTGGSEDATFQFLFADTGGGGGDDADFNGDGQVDGADEMTLQRNFGAVGQTDNSNGDANGDGVVDGLDQAAWNSQFGGPGGGGGFAGDPNSIQTGIVQFAPIVVGAAVPEPSAVALACCSALALLAYRRRRGPGAAD